MTETLPAAGERAAPLALVLRLLGADAPGTVMGAPEDWPRWAVLLPHVLAATTRFAPLPGPGEQPGRTDTAWLLDRAATYLQVHARLGEARPLAERALSITEAAHGPDHPAVRIVRATVADLTETSGGSFRQRQRRRQEGGEDGGV